MTTMSWFVTAGPEEFLTVAGEFLRAEPARELRDADRDRGPPGGRARGRADAGHPVPGVNAAQQAAAARTGTRRGRPPGRRGRP
ncbi:MAG TPA: hypothetical protein VGH88_19430 [Streptosporangiaceae bacterium]|jgi:hypothetical protein